MPVKANNDAEELFFRKKPIKLLIALSKVDDASSFVSVLAKKTDCTYSHTVKVLDHFKEHGIVEFEKKGRIKYISLTEDGKKLATILQSAERLLHKKR
ncbi:hypothetical protein CL614_06450 [archaeon]|nr:hypothetical protein [archaeon]|tara:strand:+ start:4099 stop:4392 length:294 start_codon:yes stop_codon:yes gene_type:complete